MIIDVDRQERRATLTMRWQGGALTELTVPLPKPQPAIRTDEDTIALLDRLAAHYDDATIAAILNRQGRRSATGERFTQLIVRGLRRYRGIPAHKPAAEAPARSRYNARRGLAASASLLVISSETSLV